eukprot:scaffold1247_cov251-Pinguiococcus_pyrenoidosus.AAC.23
MDYDVVLYNCGKDRETPRADAVKSATSPLGRQHPRWVEDVQNQELGGLLHLLSGRQVSVVAYDQVLPSQRASVHGAAAAIQLVYMVSAKEAIIEHAKLHGAWISEEPPKLGRLVLTGLSHVMKRQLKKQNQPFRYEAPSVIDESSPKYHVADICAM